ncbi:chitobiase/beta-hexosaminidase C-terminal domain-containing protein [Coraliomargarita sp. SDUM461004]|uniref:Chitobiase/beta-hexosaminidase C-terminal domain-containing protein n=1 Tax=Thalassobacterium sedimentorum TaxID=3041258 RepID=A0ABU1AK22_9BACT|nr:chitobiase/beta-hexosaminidase C-terminal domain-containing protein [Coraliomargarita sp. SDUM461004]MDQ8195165.1 chitobiase/beta-hexosaminidase C-terminal domain-containing protein [Coraliomargarita sp. SDUM461004]
MKSLNKLLSFVRDGLSSVFWLVLVSLGLGTSLFGVNLQGLDDSFKALTFVDGDIVGVTTGDSVVRSTNGGELFSQLRTADGGLQAIAAEAELVIVGGELGRLLRADFNVDATVWSEVASADTFGSVTGIASNGANTWLAVTDLSGDVLRSTDNGSTWSLIANAPSTALNAVAYDAVSGHWIAVGGDFFDAAAFYSVDGLSWQAATGLSGGVLNSLAVDASGTLVAVGESVILQSLDGGETFTAVSGAPTEGLNSVVHLGEGRFAAAGFEGLVVEVTGNTATILRHSDAEASTIDAVIAVDGAALLSGVDSVSAPSIDPNGGSFSAAVSVSLTVPSGTQVYYTTNGTVPTAESTLYTGAFILGSSTTVRAIAVDGDVSSPVVSADFTVATVTSEVPVLQISMIDASNFLIELPLSQPALNYQLQSSINLISWDPLQSVRPGNATALTWTVPVDGTRRFYRVLISN